MTPMPLDLPESHRPQLIYFRDKETSAPAILAESLTQQQTAMLQAIVCGTTPTEAAELTGVHRSAVYQTINQPHVRLALENTQREHYAAIAIRFQTLADK